MAAAAGLGVGPMRQQFYQTAKNLSDHQRHIAEQFSMVFDELKKNKPNFDAVLAAYKLIADHEAVQEQIVDFSIALCSNDVALTFSE